MSHDCKFTDKDRSVGYINVEKNAFELIVYDCSGEGSGIYVKYCPFCGELSPEYKKTCFKCNKISDSEYEFYNYYYDNKTIVLCGICRKELDEVIETDRKKCIKEFLK